MKQGLFILAVMVLALVVRRVVKAAMPFMRSARPNYVIHSNGGL
jgi:hypothetical protein